MEMHLLKAGDMVNDSHSIFDGLQNNNLSLMDLYVRESLQNSVDAQEDNVDNVNVDYFIDDFENSKLAVHFPEINLTKRFKKDKQRFLAICDSNTKGLNGPTSYAERNNEGGNFNSLVYQIHKPQEKEGAGGSHGLGKTIYFRMGMIGLVIFYSRVKCKNGHYENRLAATFAEDYKSDNALLPYPKNESRTGIAWWGHETSEGHTEPLINTEEIEQILNIFGLEQYTDDKTGTIIITPYIDEDFLCKSNHSTQYWWNNSVEEYLEAAIPRWYNPRITYDSYPYGPTLSVNINQNEISVDDIKVFKIFQDLYNFASDAINGKKYPPYEPDYDIPKPELIEMRKYFEISSMPAGAFAYTKVDKHIFDGEPSPFEFLNKPDLEGDESHKSIIALVRSPGMIIDYITDHELFKKSIQCDAEHYILGIFVLNSDSAMKLRQSTMSLEQYIRKSELSDHCQWEDISITYNGITEKPKIVYRIITKIYEILSSKFIEKIKTNDGNFCGAQASYYGPKLLAKLGYGRDPSKKLTTSNGKGGTSNGRKSNFHIEGIEFENGSPIILASLSIREDKDAFDFELAVKAENGAITISDWKDVYRMDCPFEFECLEIKEQTAHRYATFNKDQNNLDKGDYIITWKKIDGSVVIGAEMKMRAKKNMNFDIKLHVKVLNKELQMEIKNSFEIEKNQDTEGEQD